jgi:hypothetical protein
MFVQADMVDCIIALPGHAPAGKRPAAIEKRLGKERAYH